MLTKVDAVGGAEVFFPNLDEHPDFELVSATEWEEDNGYKISFTTYKNIRLKWFLLDIKIFKNAHII